jgi:putative intracellular protease/amidase
VNVYVDGQPLVSGKQVTGFTNNEEEIMKFTSVVPFLLETRLRERGGNFICSEPWKECVAVSDRLITGQNPASAGPLAKKVIELLRTQGR